MPGLGRRRRAAVSRTDTSSDEVGRLRGVVDEPVGAELRRETRTRFAGWALDGTRRVAGVEILVSQQGRIAAQLGVARPDVPNHLGELAASPDCGWTGTVDLAGSAHSEVRVHIVATGEHGGSATLMDRVFQVVDDDDATGEISVDGGADQLDQALELLGAAARASSRLKDASIAGSRRFSERLQAFNREAPHVRDGIANFIADAAERIPRGAVVVDIGAGDAPYRELFEHTKYVTVDWEHSVHADAKAADIVGSADSLPLDDASVDAVLMTEVIEHLRHPAAVLAELSRVLRPGGSLFLTAPLVWMLHEMPFDYWRYTPSSVQMLLEDAGFGEVRISNKGDYFTTLAQLMELVPSWLLNAPSTDGLATRRRKAGDALAGLSRAVAALSPLDTEGLLPLGFNVVARRTS